ncbi:MAG: hypothetical protein H7144_15100 [Burkholderiales bacterium]|nr:hypothetical protein [Phycisphaerae bacterium]
MKSTQILFLLSKVLRIGILVGFLTVSSSWLLARTLEETAMVKLPEKPKDEFLTKLVERINLVSQIAKTRDFSGIEKLPAVTSVEKSVHPHVVDVKIVYIAEKLSQVTVSTRAQRGLQVNYRDDGSVSMYSEGQLDPANGIVVWMNADRQLTSVQSIKDGMLFGRQIKWEKGTLIKDEDITVPQKVELFSR